jgi:hypothetical protein
MNGSVQILHITEVHGTVKLSVNINDFLFELMEKSDEVMSEPVS